MVDVPFIEQYEELFLASTALRLAGTAFILILLLGLRYLLLQNLLRRVEEPDTRYFWRQIANYVTLALVLLLVGRIWFASVGSVLTLLSLVAAALTIVNKELILNFTAWPIITWRQLFGIGDRIQINQQLGDVVDLGILYFTIAEIAPAGSAEQLTGVVTKVPNSLIFTQPVLNRSRTLDYLWSQTEVTLTKDSNWKKAEGLLQQIAQKHKAEPSEVSRRRLRETNEHHIYAEANPSTYIRMQDGNIVLTLRYLSRTKKQHKSESSIWRELLGALAEADDIELASS